MDVLIIAACGYLVFQNVRLLAETPFAEWQLVQYVLLIVTLGLVAVAILRARWWWKRRNREEGPEDDAAEAGDDADKGVIDAKELRLLDDEPMEDDMADAYDEDDFADDVDDGYDRRNDFDEG